MSDAIFTNMADGCPQCSTRLPAPISADGGWWRCTRCRGSYGPAQGIPDGTLAVGHFAPRPCAQGEYDGVTTHPEFGPGAQAPSTAVPATVQVTVTATGAKSLAWLLSSENGDDPVELALSVGPGHGGFGLYAWDSEYPEEGATFIETVERPGTPLAAPSTGGAETAARKYDDVLLPFLSLMRKELHANSDKGDRPGWLSMDANTALLEVYWHAAKLSAAVKNNDGPAIQEHSADVANMALMVLDVCGGLAWIESGPLAASSTGGAETAAARLQAILGHVRAYLPPGGVPAAETLSRIIGLLDPWPLTDEAPDRVPSGLAPPERLTP